MWSVNSLYRIRIKLLRFISPNILSSLVITDDGLVCIPDECVNISANIKIIGRLCYSHINKVLLFQNKVLLRYGTALHQAPPTPFFLLSVSIPLISVSFDGEAPSFTPITKSAFISAAGLCLYHRP